MNQDIENEKEVGHILVISTPLQGHASPLIKLSHKMTKLGMKVTFLSMGLVEGEKETTEWKEGMRFISLRSGLKTGGRWEEQEKLHERIHRVIPSYMEELLRKTEGARISGVIVDSPLSWMLAIPKKMGIKTAVFWCSNAGCLALGFKIPELLQSKFIDEDGSPLTKETMKLLPKMPEIRGSDLLWYFPADMQMQKSMFRTVKGMFGHMANADWILGNWFHSLDPAATTVTPNILPLGPILGGGSVRIRAEDSTCLGWLDAQPPRSVVYVAFGSTARFSRGQLDELAAALEALGRRFLWVASAGQVADADADADGTEAYGADFAARVADRGRMVSWAPQEAVLGHAATACFVTHCGWNSFMESLSNGVPVVCWPYFGDQMYTQRCACEAWKVGVRLEADEGGVVTRDEIRRRVEDLVLVEDHHLKLNAIRYMEMGRASVQRGHPSSNNLDYLLKQMNYSTY